VNPTLPLFPNGAGGAPPHIGALAEQAAALLALPPGAWTAAQLRKQWPSKPAPKLAALEAALEGLASQGAAHRLPGKGGKAAWSTRPLEEWLREARGRMLERIQQAAAPVKEKDLLAAAGWPRELDPEPVRRLLPSMAEEGLLKAWPGKTPSYWRLSPEESVPEALLEALGQRAMSRTEWLRQAKAKCKGASKERWERAAGELIAAGRVCHYALRIDGKKVEACARSEHRTALLDLYRPMLDRLKEEWRRLGASEEQIERFLTGGKAEAARLLWEELERLEQESRPPNPVALLRRRPALRALSKEEFDRAALELLRQGRVYMAPHDHALRLPEQERLGLVADGRGNFYVSITARH
jgi:hypothetical protein